MRLYGYWQWEWGWKWKKNRSSRYIINRPRHRHEHKYKGVHWRRHGHRRPLVFWKKVRTFIRICPLVFWNNSFSKNFCILHSKTSRMESFLGTLAGLSGTLAKNSLEQLFPREPVSACFCNLSDSDAIRTHKHLVGKLRLDLWPFWLNGSVSIY